MVTSFVTVADVRVGPELVFWRFARSVALVVRSGSGLAPRGVYTI